GVFPAWLAQVRVQVDKAGQGDQAGGVEDIRAWRGEALPRADDDAVFEVDVPWPAANDGGPLDQPFLAHEVSSPAPPSIRYKTAMRTVTPLATCATIVERSESATSAAISTPRFIGPGCMTMAWPGSRAIRSASSPLRRL